MREKGLNHFQLCPAAIENTIFMLDAENEATRDRTFSCLKHIIDFSLGKVTDVVLLKQNCDII